MSTEMFTDKSVKFLNDSIAAIVSGADFEVVSTRASYLRDRMTNVMEGMRAQGMVNFQGDAYARISVGVGKEIVMNLPCFGEVRWPPPTTMDVMEESLDRNDH